MVLNLITIKSGLKNISGADPGRDERGSSHGQIFATLACSALTFLKILYQIFRAIRYTRTTIRIWGTLCYISFKTQQIKVYTQ